MPRQLVTQIGAPQGIEINMIHMRSNTRRILALHPDRSIHGEYSVKKFGSCTDPHFTILGHSFQIQAALLFVVER